MRKRLRGSQGRRRQRRTQESHALVERRYMALPAFNSSLRSDSSVPADRNARPRQADCLPE
jgi:hypothetical protein